VDPRRLRVELALGVVTGFLLILLGLYLVGAPNLYPGSPAPDRTLGLALLDLGGLTFLLLSVYVAAITLAELMRRRKQA
jgi:hypothetical protein